MNSNIRKPIPRNYQWRNLYKYDRNRRISTDDVIMVVDNTLYYKGNTLGIVNNETDYELLLSEALNAD